MRRTLIVATPRTAAGAPTTVRLAGGGGRKPFHHDGHHYRAGVARSPRFAAQLQFDERGWSGGTTPTTGAILFKPAERALIDALAAMFWSDAPITVREGPDAGPFATRLTGTIAGAVVSGDALVLTIADLSRGIDKPLLTERFAGGGGVEGLPEAAGRIKRRSWGAVHNVEGRILDKANSIYEFGDPAKPLQSFSQLRDRGRAGPITPLAWQGSIAATFAALQAATAPQGGGVAAASIACAKWWTQPSLLTADLQGEIGAAYTTNPAFIAERVLSAASGPALAAGAVAAAAVLRPDACGLHVGDDAETAAQALDRLLLGVSLLWVLEPAGIVDIRPLGFTAPYEVVRAVSVTRSRQLPPMKARRIGWQRNHRPHNDGEIAPVLLPDEKTQLYDSFSYSSVAVFKSRWSGFGPDALSFFGGDLAIVPLSTTPGGTFLSLGDNIGSDYVQAVLGEAMPYAPEDLHVIEYDWEVGAGSGGATTYLGVVALDKDGNNLQCDSGTYAYAAGIFEQGANTGRKRRAGYFRGVAASASQGGPGGTVGIPAPDSTNPCPLPIGTVSIRPVFLANYPGGAAAGGCAAHEMRCAKLLDAPAATGEDWKNDRSYFRLEAVTYLGRSFGSKSNANLNNPPPSSATSNAWWYLIADRGANGSPGAPGQDGAGSFTLIRNDLNTEITTPSSLKKVDGGADWNTGGFSQEAYVNGAFVSARAGQTTDYLMFGLNQNGAAFGGYLDIDFAIFFNPGGVVQIYEEGTARPEESTYTTGDVFSVHYNGSTVVYAKNGVAFRTVAAAANLRLQFDCSFYSPGAALTNIVFSPAGPAGEDGNFLDVKYLRSFSQPATPSGSQPVGYSDSIPDGNGFVYETTALKAEDDTLLTPWSVPALRSEAAPAVDYNDTSTFFQRQLVKFAGGIYVLAVASSTGFAPSGTAQANARWDVYIPPAEVPPPTPPSGYVQTINLTSSAAMVNLRSIADAHTTPYPGGNATIEFVVPNGVTIAGGVGQAAIDSGTWPSSSYAIALKLTVAAGGIVRGGGGRGGNGASGLGTPGNGQAGGDALFLREHFSNGISISGVVQAGGGGGGGGRGDRVYFNGEYLVSGGGGGGGGAPNGGGGNAGFSDAGGSSAGSAGTPGGGGAGGTGENAGGAGGALGVAGSDSAGGLDRGIGGAAGFAVRKNGRTATVSGGGTITGAVG